MTHALVPELYVSDLAASISFYDLFGFAVRYARPQEAFAFIALGEAALMLEEPRGRIWLTAPLERPFGRGVNLQITVPDAATLAAVAARAGLVPLLPLETRRYARAGDGVTVRQFVIADPDGYLLRFSEVMEVTT